MKNYEAPVYAAKENQTEETKTAQEDHTETEETEKTEETEAAKGSFDLADGVYQGSAPGFRGTVTVSVQIQGGQITAIDILSSSDDAAFFNRAKSVIDKIISTQSLDVDVVSGATYSSNGIIGAVKNALTGEKSTQISAGTQAGALVRTEETANITEAAEAEAGAAGYRDGTYYGTGTGFGGTLKVEVVITGGKIASIRVVETKDDAAYLNRAEALFTTIVDTQSTNVDTVSGATYSSKGLISAVRDALKHAAIKETTAGNGEGQGNKQTENTDDAAQNTDTITGTIPYKEGIYYGTAEGYLGDITVAVVIQDKTIRAILVTEEQDDDAFFTRASAVLKEMMKKQSTDVDVVSGATYSSNGLIGAVKEALAQAKKVTNGESLVDKQALKEAVAQAKTLLSSEKSYTAASWMRFSVRLSDAEDMLSDESATEKEVSRALEQLKSATKRLEKVSADQGDGTGSKDDQSGAGSTGKDDQTGGTEETKNIYRDGTYEITVPCVPDADEDFAQYSLSLKVTIKNDAITAITDITGDGDAGNASYIKRAADGTSKYPGIVKQITALGTLNAQSGNTLDRQVDTVSRATCSSNSLIEACKNALKMAQEAQKNTSEQAQQ